jgi:hypothetical protein
MRAKLRNDKYEKLNSNEMMVRLAELWKNLAENEKKKYHDQAEQEKVRYNAELTNFYQKNPYEVIQNKTKKNHIKKPCSAYAIYLKETKLDIKQERPDLKMADILKIVAERWKLLTEERRAIFQKKALLEKEATKIKISQQNQLEDESNKKDAIKKGSPNSKRPAKSVQDSIKVESDVKIESFQTSEPALAKRPLFNQGLSTNFFMQQAFYPEFNSDYTQQPCYTMLDQTFRMQNPEPQFNFNSGNYSNLSNLLSYLPASLMQPRRSIDSTSESAFFNAKNDSSFFVKDENIDYEQEDVDPSTAAEMTPSSYLPSSSRSQILNECGSHSLEDDFKLDGVEFDRTLENFGSNYGAYKGISDDFTAF